jgi:ComF family protein
MLRLIYPRKCTLCDRLLSRDETDFCHSCRENTEKFDRAKSAIAHIAHWTALWYYKENVRKSIHRFKFGHRQRYGVIYGRHLALKLADVIQDTDILSWVPISLPRKLWRGYDQSELVCRAVGKELNVPVIPVLKKIRHTQPQSTLANAAQRRANVVGAYRAIDPSALEGKRILLIDDVVTTGATASECARTLLSAGVKEVYFAALAAAYKK